jgi:histidinol-phosphate aminotransferase
MEALAKALSGVHVYPDGQCQELRSALAQRLDLARERILVTSGADEAFDLLAIAFLERGDEIVVGDPTFTSYELAALTMGARVIKVPLKDYCQDLSAMREAVGERTKIVFVCSPLNPTGTAVERGEWEEFISQLPPGVICLLDEAYVEYMDEEKRIDSLTYLDEFPFLVVARTFSKIYGLAGLRVGYLLCSEEICKILERVKLPFNVNRLGQVAALAALRDEEHLRRSREVNREGRARIYRLLEELGFFYVPTQANFILVKEGSRDGLFQALLQKGVIVRDGEPLGIPGHVRITIGNREQNDRLEEALRAIVSGAED